MKITVDVDCTPEEARAFLGLPDVAPLQEEMLTAMKGQMNKAAQAMDPETMLKTLFPAGADNMADMQKAFWSAFGGNTEK